MATDGLWEFLTNEEVVGLVGQWLESQPTLNSKTKTKFPSPSSSSSSWPKSWFTSPSPSLPVEPSCSSSSSTNDAGEQGQRGPIRRPSSSSSSTSSPNSAERFVLEDKNAATHL
ncbi:MAG: hypothetical protein Q9191_007904, partial [Dirinaria sp. TL-2023a]